VACVALVHCWDACAQGDRACYTACLQKHEPTAGAAAQDFLGCAEDTLADNPCAPCADQSLSSPMSLRIAACNDWSAGAASPNKEAPGAPMSTPERAEGRIASIRSERCGEPAPTRAAGRCVAGPCESRGGRCDFRFPERGGRSDWPGAGGL